MRRILCLFIMVVTLLCGCKSTEVQPVINEIVYDSETFKIPSEPTEKPIEPAETEVVEIEEEVAEKEPENKPEPEEKPPVVIPEIKPLAEGERVRVALTFDDGPSKHTERLLDIFANYGGKGSFFVIGNSIEGNEATVNRILNEGHELGNHTWNHKKLTKLTSQEITDEIVITKEKILEVTGYECNIVRPPYGAFDEKVKGVCEELNMPIITWSVDPVDWKTRDKDAICADVLNGVKDGAIILCHDLYGTTVDAMEYVIPKLTECGYELVTVSELLGELEPGKVHRKTKGL
ncbi:MAG: polysaccharide deacetylase family protein [Clostridia bacterium]|nr:polysaccharide deacetylase family protein [Clostridia bacterium]